MVVRGVDPSIMLYDMGAKRTITQEMNITPIYPAVAGIIVTNAYIHGSSRPSALIQEYIRNHKTELDEAYTIINKGSSSRICRKRDVMAAVYLMLRSGIDADELSEFISIANSGFPVDGRESSAGIVLGKMVAEFRAFNRRPYILTCIQTVIRAFQDYHNGVIRKIKYTINSTNDAQALLNIVRASDGFE